MTEKKYGVQIATPSYDGKVEAGFAASLLGVGAYCAMTGVQMDFRMRGGDCFIDRARSVMVRNFLQSDPDKFTHLFFIDADLTFSGKYVAALVAADLPICAGVYRMRQEPETYPATQLDDPSLEPGCIWERDGFIAHSRVPTGFLCIRRDVLQYMSDNASRTAHTKDEGDIPFVFQTGWSDDGDYIGEDFMFCDDYMRLYDEGVFDEPIWVWPEIDFDHGGYEGSYHRWILEQQAKDE